MPTRHWKNLSRTFFGKISKVVGAFTKLIGIFVALLGTRVEWELSECIPNLNVPNGLSEPYKEGGPPRCAYIIVSIEEFLWARSHGRD